MNPIYAVALSITECGEGPTPVAHLSYQDDDRKYMLRVAWDQLPARNAGGDAGQWLYSVLLRLVENFDAHEITEASVEGIGQMKEDARG